MNHNWLFVSKFCFCHSATTYAELQHSNLTPQEVDPKIMELEAEVDRLLQLLSSSSEGTQVGRTYIKPKSVSHSF